MHSLQSPSPGAKGGRFLQEMDTPTTPIPQDMSGDFTDTSLTFDYCYPSLVPVTTCIPPLS